MPDVLLTFFASLFNVNRTMLIKESLEEDEICLFDENEEDYHKNSNDQHKSLNLKMKAIFQILFYQVVHGRKNTPLHILNAHVYKHCRSRELITAFNRQGCSVSYKTMKTMRTDIAKYTILKSRDDSSKLPLPDSFASPEDLINLEIKTAERNQKQFIISSAQNITKTDSKYLIPSWAGIESLISKSDAPIMQVGFLPFIQKPVTDYSTVYTVMLNMTKLASQLDQKILPVYCDKGVFRIVIDIYLQRENQFKNLIPMLRSFHTAKCLEHCIGKYIDDTGIDDCLSQTKVVGVKTLKSVLEGTNYARSLKAIVILAHAIESLKWEAFTNNNYMSKYSDFFFKYGRISRSFVKKGSKILSKSLRDLLANIRGTQTRI